MAEIILPGTYITVRDEGLITAGRVSTGNIGIVGTAAKGPVNEVKILGSFTEAKALFGNSNSWTGNSAEDLTLIRALEQIYNNGGKTVYAVRTASSAVAKAAYQTVDGGAVNLVKLEVRTPGTWGNEISIEIAAAEEPALVQESHTISGTPTTLQLHRTHVRSGAGLNAFSVRVNASGSTVRLTPVYGGAPTNATEVGVNAGTGLLTFFAALATDDVVTAQYEVPTANSQKTSLYYASSKEVYTIADASHLAELVNARSAWVTTLPAAESSHYDTLPANTGGKKRFGTGQNGHSEGNNGANASATDYQTSLAKLENDIINIVLLAGQDASNNQMVTHLMGHLNTTAEIKRERIGLIGSDSSTDVSSIAGHSLNSERLIFVAPGVKVSASEVLPGAYTAAAVAGLLSSLDVQASPTNKVLTIPGLAAEFSSSQLEKLVQNRVLAVEKREGYRIVKGITTATNSAWHQVTTRRIVDYAIYGVRSACNPYIGKLNNERVRGAMKATLDAFLTRMVEDEALISYELEVSATRAQEIAGEAIVNMILRPTFSIDFVKVTMFLE